MRGIIPYWTGFGTTVTREVEKDGTMTDHKPLPVAGYTAQRDEDIALANELKFAEERYMRLLDKLAEMNGTHVPGQKTRFDGRFIALARTAMQEANMWAVRSIFQPERINLPDDQP